MIKSKHNQIKMCNVSKISSMDLDNIKQKRPLCAEKGWLIDELSDADLLQEQNQTNLRNMMSTKLIELPRYAYIELKMITKLE